MLRITHTRGRMAPAVEHFEVQRLRAGSAPGSELYFGAGDGRGVAPQHAEIRWEKGAWQILDLGAPAGTFVNRVRVANKALESGDVVMLGAGGPEFRVEVVQPAPVSMAGTPLPPADAQGRVDLATAERIVADAVTRATAQEEKTAAIVAAKVKEAQRKAARNNRLLTLGVLIALVAFAGTGYFVWQAQRRAGQLTSEAGIGKSSVSRPKGELPTRVYTGREVYDSNRGAVYLLGWLTGSKVGGLCTAFAIKPNILATNAHCVNAYKEKGGTPVVTQSDSGGKVRFTILASRTHPGYKAGRGSADVPDVGLVRIEGTMPSIATLASDAELHALGSGDDVFVIGFPGRVMDPVSPTATFLQGHVGRLVGMGEQPAATLDDAVLVQHDAVTRGGNSGSPVFNQYGHVVAIHAAHLDDEDEVKVGGRQTTVVRASPYRVGMRIDLLSQVGTP
jgi:V8-like Glu-specific endopeptidase